MKNPLQGSTGQLMALAAMRHCLGRRTYIVGACCEWLNAWWHVLEPNTQNIILRDIVSKLMNGEVGGKCDTEDWRTFAQGRRLVISEEQRRWIEASMAWKEGAWPLFLSSQKTEKETKHGKKSKKRVGAKR